MIQDTEDYLQPGLAFLSDPETYRELKSDTSTEMAHKANDLFERLHRQGMLTRYTATAHSAKLKELRQQRMYFLKKVHKTPLKLRPILSCCSGPTQGISKLANTILSNYLDTVPSLVSSSTQVLKHTGTTETTQHRRTTHVSNHGREQSVPIHSSSAWHQLRSTTCYAHLPSHLQRQSKKEHGERHAQLDLEGKHHRICRKALPTTQGSGNGNTSEVHRRHPGHLGKQSSRNEQPGIPLQWQDGHHTVQVGSIHAVHQLPGHHDLQGLQVQRRGKTRRQTLQQSDRTLLVPPLLLGSLYQH